MGRGARNPAGTSQALGLIIRELRNLYRWPPAVMAEAGIPPSSLGEIERGKAGPSPEQLARIFRTLGVPVSVVYGLVESLGINPDEPLEPGTRALLSARTATVANPKHLPEPGETSNHP